MKVSKLKLPLLERRGQTKVEGKQNKMKVEGEQRVKRFYFSYSSPLQLNFAQSQEIKCPFLISDLWRLCLFFWMSSLNIFFNIIFYQRFSEGNFLNLFLPLFHLLFIRAMQLHRLRAYSSGIQPLSFCPNPLVIFFKTETFPI